MKSQDRDSFSLMVKKKIAKIFFFNQSNPANCGFLDKALELYEKSYENSNVAPDVAVLNLILNSYATKSRKKKKLFTKKKKKNFPGDKAGCIQFYKKIVQSGFPTNRKTLATVISVLQDGDFSVDEVMKSAK